MRTGIARTVPFLIHSLTIIAMKQLHSAALICRVSTREQQEDGYSLIAQEQLLRDYCERRKLVIVQRLSIAETASKYDQRKKFHQFLRVVKKSGICHIVVEKVDRLTRSGSRDAVLIDEWIEADEDRHVHFVKQSLDIHRFSASTAKFSWGMHVAMAKHATDNLSEEVRKTTSVLLQQGIWPTGVKVGYIRDKSQVTSPIQPDPSSSHLVAKIFELYDTGVWSGERLTQEAYRLGLRSRRGQKLPRSRIHCILSDPFYIGQMIYRGKLWQGAHVPIVSPDLFKRVQNRLRRKLDGDGAARWRSHDHLLRGLAYCAGCGKRLTWEIHGDRTYGYCRGNSNCPSPVRQREDKVERLVAEEICSLKIVLEDMSNWISTALRIEDGTEARNSHLRKTAYEDELDRVNQKRDRLLEMRICDEITREEYDAKKSELDEQREFISSQIRTLGTDLDEAGRKKSDIFDTAQNIASVYKDGDSATRREYLLGLVQSITASNDKVEITLKPDFKSLAKAVRLTNSSKVPKNFDFQNPSFESLKIGSQKQKNQPVTVGCPVWRTAWDEYRKSEPEGVLIEESP